MALHLSEAVEVANLTSRFNEVINDDSDIDLDCSISIQLAKKARVL